MRARDVEGLIRVCAVGDLGYAHLVPAGRVAVHLARVLAVGYALANDALADDQGGLVGDGMDLMDRCFHFRHVVGVNRDR